MAVNLVVAVTDPQWFSYLSKQPYLTEVNFWRPSTENFRALQPGELLLFKLRGESKIVGGGVFAYTNILPFSLAWEAFGEANGAPSLEKWRDMVHKIRPQRSSDICCRVLTQPFFLPRESWLSLPSDWAPNIVSLKRYSSDDEDIANLWHIASGFMERWHSDAVAAAPAQLYGKPRVIRPRLGQGAFRLVVTDSYRRRCAVTGEKTLPALDAAHIRPYSRSGEHDINNGLLLRRDIHSLFDAGYVTVDTSNHFLVSSRIKQEFENGRDYYAMHGKQILLPEQPARHPDVKALRWHNENCYEKY